MQDPSGTTSYGYDNAGRKTFVTNGMSKTLTYSYDAAGNRLNMLDSDGQYMTYAYDSQNRLSRIVNTNSLTTTYTYDGNGNRLVMNAGGSVTTYTYNAANAQILALPTGSGPVTDTYDANGNLIVDNSAGTVTTYTWDAENRLTFMLFSGNTTSNPVYNAEGLWQYDTALDNSMIWDDVNLVIRGTSSGVSEQKYTEGPGLWGNYQGLGASPGLAQYALFDMSGNARLYVTHAGAINATLTYSAFGEEIVALGSTEANHRWGAQWGYWRDGTYRRYMRERWFLSDKGVWISRDPIGFRGRDWNLYRYAENTPVLNVDPSGRWTQPKKLVHGWWTCSEANDTGWVASGLGSKTNVISICSTFRYCQCQAKNCVAMNGGLFALSTGLPTVPVADCQGNTYQGTNKYLDEVTIKVQNGYITGRNMFKSDGKCNTDGIALSDQPFYRNGACVNGDSNICFYQTFVEIDGNTFCKYMKKACSHGTSVALDGGPSTELATWYSGSCNQIFGGHRRDNNYVLFCM